MNVDFIDKKTGDMRDVMAIYEEVAKKVQNISKVEKASVMEGLAGKFHISRMTAFLDNFENYKKMLDESRNSENSAANENEKYMKSLTARIALMKQSLEEIALSLGKAFLTEGFIQTLEIIKALAHGFAGISNVVGGLPLVLGTAGIAATLLSTKLQSVAIQGTVLSRMFTTLGITSKALQISIASIGAGSALFVFGIVLEKVLKKMGEARELTEEMERKNRELTESYKENRKDIQGLVEKYDQLSKIINNDGSGAFHTKHIEEFRNISNQLAQLMPELVKGEDQYGNKILGSNEAIKSKITLLEKQTAVQEKIDTAQKNQEVKDNYEASKKELTSKRTSLDKFFLLEDNPQAIMSVKELDESISKLQDKISKGKKLSFGEKNELKNLQDLKDKYDGVVASFDVAKLSYQKSIMDMIDNNVKLDSSTSKTTKSMIDDFTTFVATSNASEGQITKVLNNVLNSTQNDKGFKNNTLEGYSDAFTKYQNAINNGADTKKIEEYRTKAVEAFTTVKEALLKLATSGGIKESDLKNIANQMDGMSNSALMTGIDFDKLSESTGKSVEELKANLLLAPQMEDMYTDMGDDAEYAAENVDKLTKSIEDAGKVYDDTISKIEELSKTLYELDTNEGLTADSISMIAEKYPELLAYINDEKSLREHLISTIDAEKNVALDAMVTKLSNNEKYYSQAYKANKEFFGNLAKEYKLDLKNATTLAQLKAQLDTKLVKALSGTWAGYYDQQAMAFTAAGKAMVATMGYQEAINSPQLKAIADYELAMKSLSSTMRNFTADSGFSAGISSAQSTAFDSVTKSQEKNNKATEESIYVSDKYKQALEKVNAELAKYEAIQKKFPEYSDEYQDALKNEIKLLGQKKKLIEDQANSLAKQIQSGNVKQYGIIKTDSGTTSNSGSTSSSGSSGKVTGRYANEINAAAIANGISAGLIKAVATQESSLGRTSSNVMQVNGYNGKGATASINKGAQMLANLLMKTGGDLDKALAAYNMGEGILGYFAKHGGYSVANMKAFSSIQKKKLGTKVYGDPNYVDHVKRYYSGNNSGNYATTSSSSFGMDALISEARKQSKKGTFTYKQIGGEFKGTYDQFLKRSLSDCSQFVQEFFQQFLGKNVPRTAATQWAAGQSVKNGQQQVGDLAFWNTTGKAHSHVGVYTGNGKVMQMGTKGLREIDVNAIKNFEGYRRIPGAGTGSATSKDSAEAAQNIDQAKSDLLQLQQDALDVANQIQDLQLQLVQVKASSYDHKNALLQDDYAAIDYKMQRENENSKQWISLQLQKEKLMQQEKKNQQDAINYIKSQIKTNKNLTQAQKDLLGDDVVSRTEALYALEQNILSERETMANKLIETYKSVLEAQKQAAVKAIDKMINDINKQAEENDYKKQLSEKQQSRQDILNEMAKLSMDNSASGKKRMAELQKQLEDSNKDITDMQTTHSRDGRIDNLNNQKDAVETKYDNLLNDERKFAKMRSDVINGNTKDIQKMLDGYYKDIKSKTKDLGTSIVNGILDQITVVKQYLVGVQTPTKSTPKPTTPSKPAPKPSNPSKPAPKPKPDPKPKPTPPKPKNPHATSAFYLRSQPKYGNNVVLTIPKGAEVEYLGMSSGWAKVKYKGKTGYGGKSFLKFHEGGIVGKNFATNNRLTEIANKLFNVKPGEQVIKSLVGELQVPPKNIPNLFTNINNLMGSLLPNQSPPIAGGNNINISFNVDKMNGSKKDVDFFMNEIVKGVNSMGGKM